ncbi:MAG: hypothetical protein ACTSRP_22375 [Candidatus Helarchaeota archaeon]
MTFFVWIAEFDANESIPKIHISINSAENLKTIFKDNDLNSGCLIFASKKPYLLKFSIEPKDTHIRIYKFNY